MTEAEIIQGILALASGLGTGGTVVHYLSKTLLERHLKKFDDTQAELKQFREKEFADLKKRVDNMQENCRHDLNVKDINTMEGMLLKLNSNLEKVQRDITDTRVAVARVESDLKGKDKWFDNINSDFQHHITDHSIHGKGKG